MPTLRFVKSPKTNGSRTHNSVVQVLENIQDEDIVKKYQKIQDKDTFNSVNY